MKEKGTTMEKVVRRPADISPREAREGLALAFPNAKVASFGTIEDDGEMVYEAKLILAEFPPVPKGDGEDDGGDEGDSAPAPFPEDAEPSEESSDDDGDEAPKEKKDKGEKGVAKKIDHLEKIVEQMAQAMGIDTSGADEEDGPPKPEADAGDGADVPPPPPVAEDAPLPPPAAPKGAPGGGGLGMPFSSVDKYAGDQHVAALRHSVDGRRSFSMAFEDGNVPMRVVAETARGMFPDFSLARIEPRDGRIDGGEPQPMFLLGMVRR